LNIIIGFDSEALNAVKGLASLLSQISTKETALMSTLDEDIVAVAAQTTAIGSLTTFIAGLETKIADLTGEDGLASRSLPPVLLPRFRDRLADRWTVTRPARSQAACRGRLC